MSTLEDMDHPPDSRRDTPSASADLANILSVLPGRGGEDDISRVMDVYEAAERVYRDASLAGTPVVGVSSSANL